MVIKSRVAQLDRIIDASEDHDLRLEARRTRARLLVQLALEGPTKEDEAEDARLRQAALDAEQDARNREKSARVQIVTTEPGPS